jgi:YwiC-like protein
MKMLINKIPAPVITKEHGSWAVLLVPIFASAGVAGMMTMNFFFLALSALAFFLAYTPGHTLLRQYFGSNQHQEKVEQAKFWTVTYLAIGITFALRLLITGYTLLILFGGLAVISFLGNFFLTRRYSKSIGSDLLAAAGLTLGGPSAYYVLTDRVDSTALLLYIFNFLFFGCSVFYVHMKIRASGIKKSRMRWVDKISFGKLNLVYHIAVVSLVGTLVALHSTSIIALLAFGPMFVHAVFGTLRLSGKVRFKKLGFLLLAQSVVFGVLLTLVEWK